MDYILTPVSWLFWTVLGVLSWILSKLFWIVVWLVLPFALAAFVALRLAEKALGQEVVRAWLKAQSMKYGLNAWTRVRRLTFALGVLPLRVLGWLALYTVWHSLVSVLWTPRWRPWPRAWAKRWTPDIPVKRKAAMKAR